MKNCIIRLLIGCLIACQSITTNPVDEQDYITKELNLINNLAVDGCSWHFSETSGTEWSRYAPDKESKSKVDLFIAQVSNGNGTWHIKVKLTFKLNNVNKDVQCGWGHIASMPEINIKEIIRL